MALSTSAGIKLYDKATAGTKKKYDLTNDMEKAEEFMTCLKSDCRRFCFGSVTTSAEIQVVGHAAGVDIVDLLSDYAKVPRSRLIETAGVKWGCEFDDESNEHDFTCTDSNVAEDNEWRARSAMLGAYLENSLDEEGKTSLANYSHLFTYVNTDGNNINDGLTMVHVILNKIMPTTRALISNKRAELMYMNPSKFGGDISKMTTRMQTLKAAIENDSGTHYADFAIHMFSACEQSNSKEFVDFAKDLRSKWETGDDEITDDTIVRQLLKKWNNVSIAKPGAAKQTGASAKDDNTSKMLVLLTALVNQQADGGSNSSNFNRRGQRDGQRDHQSSIAEWRKTKSHGESIFKDGKMYYWCEQHQEGKGLYVTHHPKDHGKKITAWEHTDRSRNVQSSKPAPANQSETGGSLSDKKLQLSDKMKAALTSQGISGTDAESLIKGLQDSNSDGAVDFW